MSKNYCLLNMIDLFMMLIDVTCTLNIELCLNEIYNEKKSHLSKKKKKKKKKKKNPVISISAIFFFFFFFFFYLNF